jgi:hypothetical protein
MVTTSPYEMAAHFDDAGHEALEGCHVGQCEVSWTGRLLRLRATRCATPGPVLGRVTGDESVSHRRVEDQDECGDGVLHG